MLSFQRLRIHVASQISMCQQCHLLLTELRSQTPPQVRHAVGFVQNYNKRQKKKQIVHEYTSENSKHKRICYTWGMALSGALGISSYLQPNMEKKQNIVINKMGRPARVRFFDVKRLKPLDIACGYGFTLFHVKLKNKKVLLGTGINTDSQIGYHESPKGSGIVLDQLIEPALIRLPCQTEDLDIVSMACGRAHSVIVVKDQGVFSLGNNSSGQCGRPVVEAEVYSKNQGVNVLADLPHDIIKVVCGQDHTLFLTESGQVWSCGLGADGQTGQGHYRITERPQKVRGDIDGEKIVSIGGRGDCVLAVSERGDVFGWGNSEYGQLASVTSDAQVNLPRRLTTHLDGSSGQVVKVSAGGSHCALLTDQGHVYVWGYGILGKGPALEDCTVPSLIPPPIFGQNELSPETRVVDIDCGLHFTLAKTDKGDLFSWGRNNQGCLGLSKDSHQYFPWRISVPAEVAKFSCGVDHVMTICRTFT